MSQALYALYHGAGKKRPQQTKAKESAQEAGAIRNTSNTSTYLEERGWSRYWFFGQCIELDSLLSSKSVSGCAGQRAGCDLVLGLYQCRGASGLRFGTVTFYIVFKGLFTGPQTL